MAQSAVFTTVRAVFSMMASVLMSAVPSSTVAISLLSCPRPMRQGTHLPQDWAWHSCKNDRDISTGHSPGGLAAMRRSTSR